MTVLRQLSSEVILKIECQVLRNICLSSTCLVSLVIGLLSILTNNGYCSGKINSLDFLAKAFIVLVSFFSLFLLIYCPFISHSLS